MNRLLLLIGTLLFVCACTSEFDQMNNRSRDGVNRNNIRFYASTESGVASSPATKVYADHNLKVLWNADDRISIFNQTTYNYQYAFTGDNGDTAGGFEEIEASGFISGNPLDNIYAVYPYSKSNKMDNDAVLTVMLPEEQHYKENSFGIGANTMVAVADGNFLAFKNVGGYLSLRLYGDNVSVHRVTIKGNNGEKIAGKASITMPLGGVPSVVMDETASDEISIVCDSPVKLGNGVTDFTDFWFVIPPVTFEHGFTIKVIDELGGTFEKSTSKSFTVSRNMLDWMNPLEVKLEVSPVLTDTVFYTSSDGKIVIPNTPSSFGGAIIISNTYENGLGVIKFHQPITIIGSSAFKGCSNLTSITIPDGVTTIGDRAFAYCTGLTSITIPDSVTSISSGSDITGAFFGCNRIEAFYGKYASEDHRCLIDNGHLFYFVSYGLTEYSIPDGVTEIGPSVFEGCSELTSITIPNGVTTIGSSAFNGCSNLTAINIPNGVTSISKSAFKGCTGLISIAIPDGVTTIGDRAFAYCTGLTSITIPDSVTSISSGSDITGAFFGCNRIEAFYGKYASEDHRCLIDNGRLFYFASYGLTEYSIPYGIITIGYGSFSGCNSLTSITIPESVTTIESEAFENCSSLTSITIPNGVTTIGSSAFNGCSNLTAINIPDSVTSLGYRAFAYCTNLTSITIPESANISENEALLVDLGFMGAFYGCNQIQAFYGKYASEDHRCLINNGRLSFFAPSGLTSYNIPDEVTAIGNGVFQGCVELTSIILPESITIIDGNAFQGCSGLTSVNIPNGVTSIGQSAFNGCTSLTSITIPGSVTSIGWMAFLNCISLNSVFVLATTVPTASSEMFDNNNLFPIFVPSESINAYRFAQGWSDYYTRIQAISEN